MLNRNQFEVLYSLYKVAGPSQRDLSLHTGFSIGTVNTTLKSLSISGWIFDGTLTESGLMELNRHKVDNAIIMAAGLSSRFVPLSFEMPKGLLKVKGEILIERQIRQLKDAGIQEIIVVVGYMKEKFFYLEEKYGVKIVVNTEYHRRNNNSTLYAVKDDLKNSYICSSDNYFTENVFERFVYDAYYSCVYEKEKTGEYYLTIGPNQKITHVSVGGEDGWIMLGHVYFSKHFSNQFVTILNEQYDEPGVDKMLWEDLYMRHIKKLDLYTLKYEPGIILEFDSMEDLRKFDSSYINNANSTILSNICSIFHCEEQEIKDILLQKKGFLNPSFTFTYQGVPYVYSLPEKVTEKITNPENPSLAQVCASRLLLDDTLMIHHESGWKISRHVGHAPDFNYTDKSHIRSALSQLSRLHQAELTTGDAFDFFSASMRIASIMEDGQNLTLRTFDGLKEKIENLNRMAQEDKIPKCLCHNSCFGFNFIMDPSRTLLTNWEYAGVSDPGNDLGTFICGGEFTPAEVNSVLETYFGRPLDLIEARHYLASIAISAYFWLTWGVYRETFGDDLGKHIYKWFKLAEEYSRISLPLYAVT